MKPGPLFASLTTRTVLLVIAVVSIAELTTFSIAFHSLRAKHLQQSAQYVAGQIRLLQATLPALSAVQRQSLPSLLGEGKMPMGAPAHTSFPAHLAARVEAILGKPVSIRHSAADTHDLWVGFSADTELHWLALPRFEPPGITEEMSFRLALALISLILIAGLFVRSIVHPLKRLGEAVSATGDGRAAMVEPQGPYEIRRLAEQHNRMVARLAQAEKKRREMLAGLTHDLRTPLARLRVRLALLEDESALVGLNRDVDNMERIVVQCLGFLRSETQETGETSPLSLADVISDIVAQQRDLGGPVTMDVDEEAASAQIAITHGDLQRMLDNLIDNALQYGAPPVEIRLFCAETGVVSLQVRDHGPGIPPEQRASVLEAFVQGESARATGGNCGLGLAIVRGIVHAHRGSLSLDDAPGGGLAVLVKFPRCL